jgi:hypothetical protein
MKFFLLGGMCVLLFSCNSMKVKERKNWIFAFKAQACSSCLKNMDVKIPKDNSEWLRFEVLGINYQNKADSIGKAFTAIINEKAKYNFKDRDLEGGKVITNGCLLLYSGKRLDSIAKLEHRKYLKEMKVFKKQIN